MARSPATARKRILSEEDHGDLEGLVGYNLKRAYVILSTDFRRALGEERLALVGRELGREQGAGLMGAEYGGAVEAAGVQVRARAVRERVCMGAAHTNEQTYSQRAVRAGTQKIQPTHLLPSVPRALAAKAFAQQSPSTAASGKSFVTVA